MTKKNHSSNLPSRVQLDWRKILQYTIKLLPKYFFYLKILTQNFKKNVATKKVEL